MQSLEETASDGSITVPTNETAAGFLVKQLSNPAEVLTVLLLIGGDIVQKAIAQVSGHFITPVSFSFGWVAYAFNTLIAVFGDGLLLPESDMVVKVIDPKGGNSQSNESWLIGRLIRDLELKVEKYYPNEMEKRRVRELGLGYAAIERKRIYDEKTYCHLDEAAKREADNQRLRESPLLITKWEAVNMRKHDRKSWRRQDYHWTTDYLPDLPHRDWVWWSYFPVVAGQFLLAAGPILKDRSSNNWTVLLITGVGNFLALLTGSLWKWKKEKFACRMVKGPKTFVLTRGNNHRHVFVIEVPRNVWTLRLEDLAIRQRRGAGFIYQITFSILTLAWILLLTMTGGLEDNTWFLFGVGLLGMAHNVVVAGAKRDPKAHGIPLKLCARTKGDKLPYVVEDDKTVRSGKNNVMRALIAAERKQSGIGKCLLPIFFPGELRPGEEEEDFWNAVEAQQKKKREHKRKRARVRRLREQRLRRIEEVNMQRTIARLGRST
ncbi:hypothetical protein F4774DRAFT_194368 [Daldinia eschscholtzii]|nr:hypothetical protein F4774DRAFT_194368 [Daldinia eschscholtzii]